MGIKNIIAKTGAKAADKVAKLSVLSPEQLEAVQTHREAYLSEVPSMDNEAAEEQTSRLLAASSVEIFNDYLDKISDMYVPIKRDIEYGRDFKPGYNIRYFEITKWVTDVKENSLEKLINVYEVLSNEECNIALIFNRTCSRTRVYLAVTNTTNADDNVDVENYRKRLIQAIKGNFPGSELSDKKGVGIVPCMNNSLPYSVACASNVPGEKSEKFLSQTIEKLLDGIVPEDVDKEYTIVLLATPIRDVENRKIHLAELYSALAPYAAWETNFTFTQSDSVNSSATFGVNVGASAGVQHGQNQAKTTSEGVTDSTSTTNTEGTTEGTTDTDGTTTTDTTGETTTHSDSTTDGTSSTNTTSTAEGHTEGVNSNKNILSSTWNSIVGGKNSFNVSDTVTKTASEAAGTNHSTTVAESVAKNVAKSVATSASKAVSNSVSKSVANTLGKAVTNTVAQTAGMYKGVNLGANVGANFARASNVTATVGKNEGIVQHFTNYNIKHLLENLEQQMKRYEQSTALGMWDFAAYVLSEDQNVANNVAYSYLALTQGENSYMSHSAVNVWRGDMGDNSGDAKEICSYIKELRHPIFALNPYMVAEVPITNVYPAVITPTTSLSGKELAYSLNFPQKSVTGFPVINCAEFGRDIVTYDMEKTSDSTITIGKIFHMNHAENADVQLSLQSLASHTFITGSTGSGKSNTVYKILDEVTDNDVKFMVIEPAKGEYKHVFGNDKDVTVYSTNPAIAPLLRINPFSFPEDIHVYEHMDRLVEIFNVCWPMYAAMPAVLKNAIEQSYVDCGWDLVTSENPYGRDYYPTFADVARNIKEIIDSSEYDNENKGAYKGSLLTRLQSLANGINGLVFSSDELSAEELFDMNVIVDLSRVGSSETKSLIMGMLILKLQEYRLSMADIGNSELKHVTVLEEAHNILKRTSTEQSMESENLVGKSVEMISNAIAEMRTYGEGFIIVDQAPGLLDMSAIRNTNTKIIMRLPDQGDRELVGKAANLDDDQIKELAKLPCGVGAVYQNEWIQSILCKIDKHSARIQSYKFSGETENENVVSVDKKVYIASLLSKGTPVGREIVMTDLRIALKKMKLPASAQVDMIKTLTNPPKTAQMIKMGYFMNVLFPDVTESVRNSYKNGYSPEEWTLYAKLALDECVTTEIDNQVRRDIIQGIITHYLYTELHNEAALTEWRQKGNLR